MDLGEDVVFQILVKLPVRSLLRLRVVCKDWCALIKSSGFKNAYLGLRRAMAVDDRVVRIKQFRCDYDAYNVSVTHWFDDFIALSALIDTWTPVSNNVYRTRWFDDFIAKSASTTPSSSSSFSTMTRWFDDSFAPLATSLTLSISDNNLEFELSGRYIGRLRFVNHVDGIVCFINGDIRFDITLVNPALRETRKFHIPTSNFGGFRCYLQCGFGYGYGNDVIDTTVYKVVAIVTVYEEDGFESPYKHIALVYYLSTNSWKILGDMSAFVPPFVSLASEETVFSHGSIHWCMQTRHLYDPHRQDAILAFDMTNESFRVIQFPRGWKYYTPDDDEVMYPHLFSLDKSTIALVYATHQLCADHVQQQIQIWVMKEYGDRDSWTLRYSINTLPRFSHVVCFWKKDKLLIRPRGGGSLMCYDLLKGQLDEEPEQPGDILGYLVTGHETLVSVKQL